jgi:hypothetical protein
VGIVVGLLLAIGVAGCGGADGGGAADKGGSPTSSVAGDRVKFAQCMREHGIDMPDPEPGNSGNADRMPDGVDPQKVDAAMQQCKQYMPNGGEPPKADPQQVEHQLEFAKCMRTNGVPDFPDPDANGAIQIKPGAGGQLGLDPSDPKFQAAQKACARYQPAGPGAGSQTGGKG